MLATTMTSFFYQLGRTVGPKLRKAKWVWSAATAPEAEAIAAERAAGADLAQAVRRQQRLCAEPDIVELVDAVGAALASRVVDKRRTFEFIPLAGDTPEAFCLPGGFVFVSRGMVDLCDRNADPLAFVLAHEIAHILEGHAMRRMIGSAVLRAATRAGAIKYAVAAKAMQTLGVEFLTKAYSRDQERDADALGLRLTCAAGFDGQAAIAIFEKLAALEQPDGPLKYFSTHPEAQERIDRLSRLLAQRQNRLSAENST
jgi:predicted Zn-dependent protease